jgi:hypothetical protein
MVVAACALATAAAAPGAPLVGFTVHWDFFASAAEAERLVTFAIDGGARVLNVVPPPHIWEQPESLAILRRIFALAAARGVGVMLNRIDGSSLPGPDGERTNWLYSHVLTEVGRLPSGRRTPDFFLTTVGDPDYERWLREETAYYAATFSGEPNLLGFSVGLFNEPFVSQRGSLLCFDEATDSYEVGQYTRYAQALWRRDLARRFAGDLAAANRGLGTAFPSWDAFPMPKSEADPAFGDAPAAYLEFVSAINRWVVERLEECRTIWHGRARRDVPFVLQFSGYVPEKFAKGRAAFAALDIFDWMRRADALGLSAYTNCEYPDWGHASLSAMASFLRLARLLGKRVYVLEFGNECDGAVLSPPELGFVASVVRPLQPAAVIYEFLRTSYDEHFATSAGKLLGPDLEPRPAAVAAVRAALAEAALPAAAPPAPWVLDDLAGAASEPSALEVRRRLAALAMRRPLTFVPAAAVAELPRGSVLVVPGAVSPALRARLAAAGVALDTADALLAPPAGGGAGPR